MILSLLLVVSVVESDDKFYDDGGNGSGLWCRKGEGFLFLYLRWTDQPYQFCFVLCRVIDVRDDSDDVFV